MSDKDNNQPLSIPDFNLILGNPHRRANPLHDFVRKQMAIMRYTYGLMYTQEEDGVEVDPVITLVKKNEKGGFACAYFDLEHVIEMPTDLSTEEQCVKAHWILSTHLVKILSMGLADYILAVTEVEIFTLP